MRSEKKRRNLIILLAVVVLAALGIGAGIARAIKNPEKQLNEYMAYIEQQDYESMYKMLDEESRKRVSRERKH